MAFVPSLYPGAALIATGLSLHGYRKGSLSGSGAIAAWVVGYGHLANPLKVFGVTMIVFYLVGSRATKVKADVKARLEDGPDPAKPGGNRDALQVLSSSLPSLLAALLYRGYVASPESSFFDLLPLNVSARPLIYMALGHFSTCLADTLASELGILSSSPPFFILSGKTVPPGTNGGVSLLGLGASVAGGAIMALTMIADLLIEDPGSPENLGWAGEMLLFGTLAGLAGSLLDSLLGALFQRTLYSTTEKRILTDHSTKRLAKGKDVEGSIIQIGPGMDLLSNTAVNFVCGCVMGCVGYAWGQR
ncbi:integral membrane protein DUF92-domain-containing protein [Dioszegia hungarica]|uniref:Integral membrane protein DUF92-domain-containing protein n=1 Tax=Dioszegia hungarica TaxID=4972 RepID=A0AA38H9L6_9TREE|nr:integral membrane protein DUF92-domain-containing protein [Dioszegia hungarica]KAI9635419.1 integral membrane protein DUF92-domain-containing protein [Dioszegia hungarica]